MVNNCFKIYYIKNDRKKFLLIDIQIKKGVPLNGEPQPKKNKQNKSTTKMSYLFLTIVSVFIRCLISSGDLSTRSEISVPYV